MTRYVGRFAPSPTGPLHAGSLVAAVASFCDALVHDGTWLLRIEDVDRPRTVPGADRLIVETLAALGMVSAQPAVHQSTRDDAYAAAFARLDALGLVYPCGCTRSEIAAATGRRSFDGEAVYPGTCAHGLAPGRAPRAWRLRMPDRNIVSEDRWAGPQAENPALETGDIVIRRADGLWAYQLAVVVDDMAAGVTHIVRGDDLLHSTARQLVIRAALGGPPVRHLHVPVLRDRQGHKLSKQTLASPIDMGRPLAALAGAARHLGLELGGDASSVAEFWRRAPHAWETRLRTRAAM